MLQVKAKWALSGEYVVSLDGTQVMQIHDTHGTESGRFEWEGRKYGFTNSPLAETGRIQIAHHSRLEILWAVLQSVLRMLFRQVMYRGVFVLTDETGARVARAEGQGKGSYLFDINDRVLTLAWSPGENRFRLEEGGKLVGWVRQPSGIRRGVEAELPRELSMPVQVFMAIRALERFEFLVVTRDD